MEELEALLEQGFGDNNDRGSIVAGSIVAGSRVLSSGVMRLGELDDHLGCELLPLLNTTAASSVTNAFSTSTSSSASNYAPKVIVTRERDKNSKLIVALVLASVTFRYYDLFFLGPHCNVLNHIGLNFNELVVPCFTLHDGASGHDVDMEEWKRLESAICLAIDDNDPPLPFSGAPV
ncbi:hypothetical protein V8G54_004521 [Vigna mungo]|uniref:Uncharacterized protein n=1 Tax=Vigna mungo TaxID=3915 RepID=A0AAQ3PDZ2_VIGMU